jgi:cytochrome P450
MGLPGGREQRRRCLLFSGAVSPARAHFVTRRCAGPMGLTQLTNEEWHFHRNLMGQSFKHAQMPRMAGDMLDCSNHFVKLLTQMVTASTEPVDILPALKTLTMCVVPREMSPLRLLRRARAEERGRPQRLSPAQRRHRPHRPGL